MLINQFLMLQTKKQQEFKCLNCRKQVSLLNLIGSEHRNHCPSCLYSQHLDLDVPGDRKSECKQKMEPIGITLKHEGVDKYGKVKEGELMIIHKCLKCSKISINRVAGDDNGEEILKVFKKSKDLAKQIKEDLQKNNIKLLQEKDKDVIYRQLFGKNKKQE